MRAVLEWHKRLGLDAVYHFDESTPTVNWPPLIVFALLALGSAAAFVALSFDVTPGYARTWGEAVDHGGDVSYLGQCEIPRMDSLVRLPR